MLLIPISISNQPFNLSSLFRELRSHHCLQPTAVRDQVSATKEMYKHHITYTNTVHPYSKSPTPYAGLEPYTKTALTSQQSLHSDLFFSTSHLPARDYQKRIESNVR
jgi:hypothetical protein